MKKPVISCACKVARRDECFKRKRCGCSHDGLSTARKRQRRRGQREHPLKGRACLSKTRGENARRDARDRGVEQKSQAFVALSDKKATAHDLECALGWEKGSLTHNLPNAVERSSPERELFLGRKRWRNLIGVANKATARVFRILCPADPQKLQRDLEETRRELFKPSRASKSKEDKKLLDCLMVAKSKAVKNSVESRAMRAVLSTLSSSRLTELGEKSLACGGKSRKNAREDFCKLMEGLTIAPKKKSNSRFRKETVDCALKCALPPLNVGVLSWGAKIVKVGGCKRKFPALCRKRSPARIFEAYKKWRADNSHFAMKRARFLEVVGAVTAGEARLVRAVDYVTGFLVSDNVDLLKRIVEWLTFMGHCTSSWAQTLSGHLDITRGFLKRSFDRHVIKESERPSNSISHSVGAKDCNKEQKGNPVGCNGCKLPFHVIDEIARLAGANEELVEALGRCRAKMHLFMGHRARTVNQQRAIESISKRLKQQREDQRFSNEALAVIDFKMKFGALYWREKTVEHYGMRGISWHGTLIHCCTYDDEHHEAVAQRAHFDDISLSDNKQDSRAVVSILESLLMRVKEKLPQIKFLILQSDNAKCCMSAELALTIPLLSMIHGARATRFIHTETQDGKSLLDARFAPCAKWVREHLKEGHNAVTASQLVTALMPNGGLPNTLVKLARHDRARLERLENFLLALSKRLGPIKKRMSDISHEYPGGGPVEIGSHEEIDHFPDFSMKRFLRSGVGSGLRIDASPSNETRAVRDGGDIDIDAAQESESGNSDDEGETTSRGYAVELRPNADYPHEKDSDDERSSTTSAQSPSDRLDTMTGIKVMTQSQLRRMQKRWKERPVIVCKALEDHSPEEELHDQKNDMLSCAKRAALSLCSEGFISFRDGRKDNVESFELCSERSAPSDTQWSRGWARRPKRGEMHGKRRMSNYRAEIRAMLEEGAQSAGRKRSPAGMWEELLERHPGKFNIPSESEIRQEIGRLLNLQKQGKSLETDAGGKRGRKGMEGRRRVALEELLDEDEGLKPRRRLELLKERFSGELDFPSFPKDGSIKSKISSLKQQRKVAAPSQRHAR